MYYLCANACGAQRCVSGPSSKNRKQSRPVAQFFYSVVKAASTWIIRFSRVILSLPCEQSEARNPKWVRAKNGYRWGTDTPIPCYTMLTPWSTGKHEAEQEAFCWRTCLLQTGTAETLKGLQNAHTVRSLRSFFKTVVNMEHEQDVQELL